MRQSIKKIAPAVVIVSLLILFSATAEAKTSSPFQIKESIAACPFGQSVKPKLRREYLRLYHKADKRFSNWSPGRNIVCDGINTHHGAKPASKAQVAQSVTVLKGKLYPTQTVVTPLGATPVIATVGGGTLSDIANCESGGDPGAISPGGTYRGKYQFDYRTWQEAGGTGDPAAAPEAEQDMRAASLYASAGPGRWPVCGK